MIRFVFLCVEYLYLYLGANGVLFAIAAVAVVNNSFERKVHAMKVSNYAEQKYGFQTTWYLNNAHTKSALWIKCIDWMRTEVRQTNANCECNAQRLMIMWIWLKCMQAHRRRNERAGGRRLCLHTKSDWETKGAHNNNRRFAQQLINKIGKINSILPMNSIRFFCETLPCWQILCARSKYSFIWNSKSVSNERCPNSVVQRKRSPVWSSQNIYKFGTFCQ